MTGWLSTAQVHDQTGRHVVTIRRAAESGVLHGHQTGRGGIWTFKPEAVTAWMESRDGAAACACRSLRVVRKTA